MIERIVREYIYFVRVPFNGKTGKWGVVNKRYGDVLGGIFWYGPWRRYVYETVDGCLLDRGCLDDIGAFIGELMAARQGVLV